VPNPVTITFKDGFDWKTLAKQKEELVHASLGMHPSLDGILEIIDVIQDEAEKAGHPVVFLTEDDDE